MPEVKHLCDHCGETILKGWTHFTVLREPEQLKQQEFDLCGPCTAEFVARLGTPTPISPIRRDDAHPAPRSMHPSPRAQD